MKELSALIDTNRELLGPFRKAFKEANSTMAGYEQQIATKSVKGKARMARLKLKRAVKEYNQTMEEVTG